MDQVKIGKFISDERKAKGYTQKQLSELLEISDKTISKWECGNGFPEASLLLPLCNELEITVNELLTGERISQQNYKKKAEENMVNMIREKEENKQKILLTTIIRSVYKELHADCETGAADNKLRLNTKHRKSARYSACFVVRGFQRGLPLGTRLCLQSVVCYTLCRRCCENAVATGEGKGI